MPTVTEQPKSERRFDIYVKTKSCSSYQETLQSFIVEDIFPTDDFPEVIREVMERMKRSGYGESVFFEMRRCPVGRSESFRSKKNGHHDTSDFSHINLI
jgi:hypothetical protein